MECRRAALEGVPASTSSVYWRGPFVTSVAPDSVAVRTLPPFEIETPVKSEESPSSRGTEPVGKLPMSSTVWFCATAGELKLEQIGAEEVAAASAITCAGH